VFGFAVGEPGLDIGNVETVLDTLAGNCYLSQQSRAAGGFDEEVVDRDGQGYAAFLGQPCDLETGH
jgi:hypothetical protein